MREGAIEETHIPRNPLDVLAQQIVAICAEDEIAVDDLHELVRGAYPFADLSRAQLENVLDMLAGRYPSDEFAELRPRIVWDRTAGVVKGRQGARRLAVTNAGTIPDRGLYGVFQVDGGGRVGELDEEMVYEARQGQTFMLGASTWRIEEITRDRVLVSPAPGVPGAVPFWKGEGVGRPFELGEKIGRASREIVALSDAKALERLTTDYHLDPLAAKNLLTYLREQAAANGGVVPSDRTVVVERFRDEIGDWRVCILTPFGARVHAPWAMALGARLRDSLGLEVQSIWSDDGIAFHLPEADVPPPLADLMLTAEEIEELVVQEVGQTALFGARFRENAGRALLIPRRRPGQRTPLWQQRLKAQSLLQVARNYGSFPIVLETYRECLQDVFDLPALKRILHGLQTRELDLVDVETPSASPFASSLLFAYIATYMYEDDTPAGRAPRAGALARPRPAARAARPGGAARPARPGGARGGRGAARGRPPLARRAARPAPPPRRPPRRRGRRGPRRRARGGAAGGARAHRRRGAADRRRGRGPLPRRARRDAAGRAARGVPRGRARRARRARSRASRARAGRSRPARRPTATASSRRRRRSCSHGLERADRLVRGELRPGGVEREWCDPDVLRRLRRASLAALRREVEPAEQAALGRFLPAWHGIDRRATLREALVPLQALAAARSRCGRARCCAAASPATSPPGSTRCARPARSSGSAPGLDRVALYFREDAALLGAPAGAPAARGRGARRRCAPRSAARREFWPDLLAATGLDAEEALPGALGARLGGRGDERRVDAAARRAPLRHARRRPAAAAVLAHARGRLDVDAGPLVARRAALPGRRSTAARSPSSCSSGRGSSCATACAARGSPAATAPSTASCGRSRRSAPAAAATSSRGSAARSSRCAGAVERLRELQRRRRATTRSCSRRPTRRSPTARRCRGRGARAPARPAWPGAHVVLLGGAAALYVERGGRTLVPLREPEETWLRPALAALADWVREGHAKRLAVERFDGRPVAETEAMPLLVEAGFLAGPRRAVLRP